MHATVEELRLINDSIYLALMLVIIDANRYKVMSDHNLLQDTFLTLNDAMVNKLHGELLNVKKKLKELKIKVEEADHGEGTLNYKYWSKGYEQTFAIWREHARSELARRLGQAIAELGSTVFNR